MSKNLVILVGRIGKDPETRYMPNGEAVTNVSLATSETWKDKSGEKQEKTEWHSLVFYRRLAEIAGEYLKKGAQVYIEGKLQTRKYQTKEGQERYTTEIIVNEMQMLGGKPSGASGQSEGNENNSSAPAPARTAAAPARQAAPAGKSNFDNFDDDIPFMRIGFKGAGVDWRSM